AVFCGDGYKGGPGSKNAASILKESMMIVNVSEFNSSKLCFTCHQPGISPVIFASKLHQTHSRAFRSRSSYLATSNRQQQHSRRRNRLCLHCKRMYDRDIGASINLVHIALYGMYL